MIWIVDTLKQRYGQVKAFAFLWRKVIVTIALFALGLGVVWSIRNLDLDSQQIQLMPVLAAFCLTLPASILFNAWEFRLCGAAVGCHLSWRHALLVTTAGTIANILPVPASLAIRGKALVDAGTSLGRAGRILGLAAIMWVATAFVITGLSLPAIEPAIIIATLGVGAMVTSAALIHHTSNIPTALGFIIVRLAMMALFVLRLMLLYFAIGVAVQLADVGILSGVGVVSAAIAIVPAGLGVTEAAGAVLASLRDTSPAAAFLVLALNRGLSLAGNGLVFGIMQFVKGNEPSSAEVARCV